MARRDSVTDWRLALLALALSAFGVAMVYSAGQLERATIFEHVWRVQLGWVVMGVCAAYLVSRTSSRFLDWVAVPAFAASLLVLAALLVKGLGSGGGTAEHTKSWLTLFGRRLGQPSEFAKIAVILMLAKLFASRREAPDSLFDLWKPMAAVGVPWVLIMLQPDLGTGMVLIGIFFAMVFWAGASWTILLLVASPAVSLVLAFSTGLWGAWFLILLAVVAWYKPYVLEGAAVIGANIVMGVVAPMLWGRLEPYQQGRLVSFLNPESDRQVSGYHLFQSQVAIGSGGWIGKGFTLGTQKRLSFLPTQHTDFIFPVIGEELGFIGVTVALVLLCVLLLRSVRIATRALDPFAGLVAFGLASAWCVHVIVNVGMTVGLMPITGIPLPFFSYGGSFMVACWIGIGILLRVSASGRGRAETLVI